MKQKCSHLRLMSEITTVTSSGGSTATPPLQTIKCCGFSINKRLLTGRQFTTNISTRGILRRLESTENVLGRARSSPSPTVGAQNTPQIPYSQFRSPADDQMSIKCIGFSSINNNDITSLYDKRLNERHPATLGKHWNPFIRWRTSERSLRPHNRLRGPIDDHMLRFNI